QVAANIRVEEVPAATVVDEVEGAAGRRCDDGQADRGTLLEGLPEGLLRAGVDEDVEGGVGACELLPGEGPKEGRREVRAPRSPGDRLGQASTELVAARALADQDETGPRQRGDLREPVVLLLRGQPADVPQDGLAGRRQRPLEG